MKSLVAYKRGNGKWGGLGRSMKDLLIGYDMIYLIGLQKMKRRLAERGTFHRVTVVASGNGDGFTLFDDRGPVLDFVTWQGGLSALQSAAARSAMIYLRDDPKASKLWACRNWTRKRTQKAIRILASHGLRIQRAQLQEFSAASAS